MFKIEKLQTFGWEGALRGMRNPKQSHHKSDSEFKEHLFWNIFLKSDKFTIGPNDLKLCKQLIKGGSSHRKFCRFIKIHADVIGSLKFFDQFSTYKFIDTNSESQMHKMGSRLLTKDDFIMIDEFQLGIINDKIKRYRNIMDNRDDLYSTPANRKRYWEEMIYSIPQGYLYTRTIDINYEVFFSMYLNRKGHKLEEWRVFCDTLRKELPYMDQFLSVLEEPKKQIQIKRNNMIKKDLEVIRDKPKLKKKSLINNIVSNFFKLWRK